MLQRLCLMASHGYPPGLVLHHQLGLPSANMNKVCQTFLPSPVATPDIIRYQSPCLQPNACEESRKAQSEQLDYHQYVNADFSTQRAMLIDVQSICPNPIHFGFGIVEQCTKRDTILQFLKTGTAEAGIDGANLSLLLDMMNLQLLGSDEPQQPFSSLIYPNSKFYIPKPLLDFVQDSALTSEMTARPDGQLSFLCTETEMKDFLSVAAELYLSKTSRKGEKRSMLVPYFSRVNIVEVEGRSYSSVPKIESTLTAPLRSPEKVKVKPSQKKSKKVGNERDLYKKNSVHACESLLSLMVDKRQRRKTAILSLKKSGPELPEFLTQVSAAIAGTGLAVLLSVICEIACRRVPICTSKLFNTGFGFALVWLSWAVIKLRSTIVSISKNAGKLGSREEDMIHRLDKNIGEIYRSAAALLAVAVLRLA